MTKTKEEWAAINDAIIARYVNGNEKLQDIVREHGTEKNALYFHLKPLGYDTDYKSMRRARMVREGTARPLTIAVYERRLKAKMSGKKPPTEKIANFVKFIPEHTNGCCAPKLQVVINDNIKVLIESTDTEGLKNVINCFNRGEAA